MKKAIRFLRTAGAACSAILICCTCSLLPDSPLRILSWTPGGDVDSPSEAAEVKLIFNREPEPVSTDRAFSITAGGIEVPGRTRIDGRELTFSPYSKMQDNTDYELNLSVSAEDCNGISLSDDFQVRFRIGKQGRRPSITNVSPADKERVDSQEKPIVLSFDTAVNFDSVLQAFSITPSVSGVSGIDAGMKVFTFTPAEKLKWQQEYRIVVSTDLKSIDGYSLSEEYSSCFTPGTDGEPPLISTAVSDDGSVELIASPADAPEIEINTGWEKDRGLKIIFSEQVDELSAKAAVKIEPDTGLNITFDDNPAATGMLISFEENLCWNSLYRLDVSTGVRDLQDNRLAGEYIYYIFVNGPASAPPILSRVEMIPGGGTGFCIYSHDNPASEIHSHPILDTSIGDRTENPFFIDYYFSLASGAELPFFGFIENFLISPDDSCISVDYLDFQVFNPGDSLTAASAPVPTPQTGEAVVRLVTSLTDDSEQSGLILFQVYSDFSDSLGNLMSEDWTAELFDEDS